MKNKFIRGSLLITLSIVLLVLPNAVWVFLHKDEYFIKGADKIAYGLILSLIYIVAIIRGALKNISKRMATLLTLIIVTIIAYFLEAIIHDLVWILIMGNLGYFLYLYPAFKGEALINYYKAYKDEHARMDARNEVISESQAVVRRGNV